MARRYAHPCVGTRASVEGAVGREEGRSAGELAEAQSVTRSFVNRLLRLTLLAPDIVEAILEGRPPKGYGTGGVDRVKGK